jgi:hypothetical protein
MFFSMPAPPSYDFENQQQSPPNYNASKWQSRGKKLFLRRLAAYVNDWQTHATAAGKAPW